MKDIVSKSTKIKGLTLAALPILVVGLFSNVGLAGYIGSFWQSGGEPSTAPAKPTSKIVIEKDANKVASKVGILESVIIEDRDFAFASDRFAPLAPTKSPKEIVPRVAVSDDTSLTERDWIINTLKEGMAVDASLDCHIPEIHVAEFTALLEQTRGPGSDLPAYEFEIGKLLGKARGRDCSGLAFRYFKSSAESGYDRAYAETAKAYRKGLGTEPDFRKAVINYEISARLGFANSAYRLIEMTERGTEEIAGDAAMASAYLEEFRLLIENKIRQGDAVAARSLARLFGNSNLLQSDPYRAMELYEYAANLGDAIAMHDLALMRMKHQRFELKRKDIFPLLLKSSELGYSAAFTALGRLHLTREFGLPRSEAPRWFRWGVEAGHAGAMQELALLYFKGDLVASDITIAKQLATQGARLKHRGSRQLLEQILASETHKIVGN